MTGRGLKLLSKSPTTTHTNVAKIDFKSLQFPSAVDSNILKMLMSLKKIKLII